CGAGIAGSRQIARMLSPAAVRRRISSAVPAPNRTRRGAASQTATGNSEPSMRGVLGNGDALRPAKRREEASAERGQETCHPSGGTGTAKREGEAWSPKARDREP